jgi:transposase-like protein
MRRKNTGRRISQQAGQIYRLPMHRMMFSGRVKHAHKVTIRTIKNMMSVRRYKALKFDIKLWMT